MPGVYDFEIRASSGELLGLIERGGHGPAYASPHPAEPVTFRAVIREDGSNHPPAVKFPPGFIPPDPARAAAAERARWGGTGPGPPMASRSLPGAWSPAGTTDYALCTSALLHPPGGRAESCQGAVGLVS